MSKGLKRESFHPRLRNGPCRTTVAGLGQVAGPAIDPLTCQFLSWIRQATQGRHRLIESLPMRARPHATHSDSHKRWCRAAIDPLECRRLASQVSSEYRWCTSAIGKAET